MQVTIYSCNLPHSFSGIVSNIKIFPGSAPDSEMLDFSNDPALASWVKVTMCNKLGDCCSSYEYHNITMGEVGRQSVNAGDPCEGNKN